MMEIIEEREIKKFIWNVLDWYVPDKTIDINGYAIQAGELIGELWISDKIDKNWHLYPDEETCADDKFRKLLRKAHNTLWDIQLDNIRIISNKKV